VRFSVNGVELRSSLTEQAGTLAARGRHSGIKLSLSLHLLSVVNVCNMHRLDHLAGVIHQHGMR
jgi:hypothetical protein